MLDQGKSLMLALSQDAALNRPVEAREHVRRMHELFFTLAPDKAAIESNINRAMYRCSWELCTEYLLHPVRKTGRKSPATPGST